ncbi:MAG: hypothetical protein LW832_07525 [Parachlamydia sp.]|jgi:phospholipase/lecithinase/hemolysin|nr:hypothetical protein [Parachlamydia sp.]
MSVQNSANPSDSNWFNVNVQNSQQTDKEESKNEEFDENALKIAALAIGGFAAAVGFTIGGMKIAHQHWVSNLKTNTSDIGEEVRKTEVTKPFAKDDIAVRPSSKNKVETVAASNLIATPTNHKYNRVFYVGDSLSEKGRFYQTSHFYRHGGSGSKHRFTNALNWADSFDTHLANTGIIDSIKKTQKIRDNADISDLLITRPQDNKEKFNIDTQTAMLLNNRIISKNYSEGGATTEFTGLINHVALNNLENLRDELLQDNQAMTDEEKANTLCFEWTSANDMITVPDILRGIGQTSLSTETAQRVVKVRMENVDEMYKAGFRKFVLVNLPDLSKTPRFRRSTEEQSNLAFETTNTLNGLMEEGVKTLQNKYPDAKIVLFDINELFSDLVSNPGDYGFNAEYNPVLTNDFSRPVKRDEMLFKNDPIQGNINYKVLDPCGQERMGFISYDSLPMGQPLDQNLLTQLMPSILEITNECGHTSTDLFEPLNETKAYQTFMQENGQGGVTMPSVKKLFFDDVHPTSHMHHLIKENVDKFLKANNFEYSSPLTEEKVPRKLRVLKSQPKATEAPSFWASWFSKS